ncbi:aminotransferase class I/II-fold pyridoxal phosphate-dependent enzyme [Paenibacillus sp. Marseille-Q4541]|uniref:aminotransferase class I/II-fold pyridoxal phosphate-dependent enzyme n=1 Tax=Paenibacillus sp. Marseille-Q4541 TaxID=2831522 RepID=UPI001BAB9079|nr:aminotransferase class I/II-fold pyridoxal phosphate-dependent enzyme [Paenibacillus sp. Marseille-Q4541]
MDNHQKNKEKAPLYDALIQYKNSGKHTYHVPGHKNGQVYSNLTPPTMLQKVMSIDATEITGLDDLHHPETVIEEAQQLAADCFGAEESFFLVAGSTSGNIALLLTVCTEPGDLILVQRNVHKSVIHGLMLAGAHAVFLAPEIDSVSGLATAPSLTTIKAALQAYPNAKGVFLTMPNYYGMGFELSDIARACHDVGVPLLVDEAHGAHYGQHPALPNSALAAGTDGVVQSTHKMLSAMTMGAMVHVQGKLLDRELMKQRLSMIQSSSPSYPLMASLDLARLHLHRHGADAFTAGLAAVNKAKSGIQNNIPRFGLLGPSGADAGYTTQDPFKLVIYDKEMVLSGYELQRRLEDRGCVPEMSDDTFVVLLFSLGSSEEDAMHLLDTLLHISLEEEPRECEQLLKPDQTTLSRVSTWNILQSAVFSCPVSFHLRKIAKEQKEQISIGEASGRIAAEMVIPYPPGIPLLYPGEMIDENMKNHLILLRESGAKIQGNTDSSLDTILVMIEK